MKRFSQIFLLLALLAGFVPLTVNAEQYALHQRFEQQKQQRHQQQRAKQAQARQQQTKTTREYNAKYDARRLCDVYGGHPDDVNVSHSVKLSDGTLFTGAQVGAEDGQIQADKAIYYCNEYIRRDAKRSQPHYQIGRAFWQQKRYDVAINAFNRSIELNPERGVAYYYLAQAYEQGLGGLPQDSAKAMENYKKSAHGNFRPALELLANQGIQVKTSAQEARELAATRQAEIRHLNNNPNRQPTQNEMKLAIQKTLDKQYGPARESTRSLVNKANSYDPIERGGAIVKLLNPAILFGGNSNTQAAVESLNKQQCKKDGSGYLCDYAVTVKVSGLPSVASPKDTGRFWWINGKGWQWRGIDSTYARKGGSSAPQCSSAGACQDTTGRDVTNDTMNTMPIWEN